MQYSGSNLIPYIMKLLLVSDLVLLPLGCDPDPIEVVL
jgi:hypothetical protein